MGRSRDIRSFSIDAPVDNELMNVILVLCISHYSGSCVAACCAFAIISASCHCDSEGRIITIPCGCKAEDAGRLISLCLNLPVILAICDISLDEIVSQDASCSLLGGFNIPPVDAGVDIAELR